MTTSQTKDAGGSTMHEELIVDMRNVSMTFAQAGGGNKVTALNDVSMSIRNGEIVALIGPSGCGKSTALRVIGGLTTPTTGEVDVGVERHSRADNGMSMMFQIPALLDWRTAEGNVLLPLESQKVNKAAARQRASEMLELVGLGHARDRRPFELSGGMQQRVALARSLISNPKLLLLDEPFGALDAITRDEMCIQLSGICERLGMTTLLVTHSITEAIFLADRILVMSKGPGRIIAELEVPLARPRRLDDRVSPIARELESQMLHLLVDPDSAQVS